MSFSKKQRIALVTHSYMQTPVPVRIQPEVTITTHSSSHPLFLPEILQIVFAHARVKDLKEFRLVNRLWNQEVCRVLQKSSFVYLKNGADNNLQQFVKVLRSGKENESPSPFQKLHLTIQDLDDDSINIILQHSQDLPFVHIRLNPSKNAEGNNNFPLNMYKLLRSNAQTLQYFDCTLTTPVAIKWDFEFRTASIQLPNLKGLNYDDTDVPVHQSKWTELLIQIIEGSPNLSNLNIITFDDCVLATIMDKVNLSSLEEIFIQDFTPRHFPKFSALQLPRLKSLNLDVVHISEENMLTSDDLLAIVKNFSKSIEELSVNWAASTPIETPFPFCPHLRQLTVDNWPGSLGMFNNTKLPLLDTITVYEEIDGNLDIPFATDPHPGVENLKWEGNPRFENMYTHIDEKRVYTIVYISLQFPNLRYLDLTCAASDEMIRTIATHMPRLEVLELTTECVLSEAIFTGINKYTLQHFLDSGISLDACTRTSSLTDMLNLKKLALHSYDRKGFAITNNAVTYGIAEMPSLEFFHIDWSCELDTEIIFQNLTHLARVVIKNYEEFLSVETLVEMRKLMPQIEFVPDFEK